MRLGRVRGALSAALLALTVVFPAWADEVVSFATAPPPLAAGSTAPVAETPLRGYLTRPKGNGPFPAVVLLHSCLGLPSNRAAIEGALAGWGFVALFVDDFATRGLKDTCAVDFPEGVADAFGGLAYLAGRPDVDRKRIAVVGYSQGAYTALEIASSRLNPPPAGGSGLRFRAVAAYYPACENQPGTRLVLPTLILVGSADTVTPAAACQQLANSQGGADLKLIVYPGVGHVFDDPQFASGKQVLGMTLRFDAPAAADALSALHDFLAAKL